MVTIAMDTLKQVPWWAWLLTGFGALMIVGSLLPEESAEQQAPATNSVAKEPTGGSITAAELAEFDNAASKLDPDEKLITGVVAANDLVVDVSVSQGFVVMTETQQGEVAIAMRDALSKICECSPYLKFQTAAGQRIVDIGRKEPEFK